MKELQLHMSQKHLPEEAASTAATFFLIRTTPDPIPCPPSTEEATSALSRCFEMGTLSGRQPLQALAKALTHVYVPMLTAAGTYVASGCWVLNVTRASSPFPVLLSVF